MLPTSIAASYSAPSTSMSSQSPHYSSQTSTQQQTRNSQSTIYPLCTSGWCLTRLRLTCSLWAFVRTGVIEKVWEEEVPVLPASVPTKSAISGSGSIGLGKPPIPPRRRGLWGMASAFGERAASWGSETDKDKGRPNFTPSTPDKEVDRKLPPRLQLILLVHLLHLGPLCHHHLRCPNERRVAAELGQRRFQDRLLGVQHRRQLCLLSKMIPRLSLMDICRRTMQDIQRREVRES